MTRGTVEQRFSLLLLVLGIVSVVAACRGNDVSPTVTSGTAATRTSGMPSTGEVARLFDYDRRQPLAITRVGLTARLPPARELDGVTVHSITYASPKGGEVPALVVVPRGKARSRASSSSTACRTPKRACCRLGSTWPAPGRWPC